MIRATHPIAVPARTPVPGQSLRPALFTALLAAAVALPAAGAAQTLATGPDGEWIFHTFSIVAVDPETGETGVAVTTRNGCVGAAVPWVRAGVGAVATQASSRVEYGTEFLDLLAEGVTPSDAMARLLAADPGADRRQIGVVSADGSTAQHTGSGASAWAGHRAGDGYAVQGNLLVGPQVLDAVAESFEATAGSGRHLSDRLVAAIEAGQAQGGDARHGRIQSAAVLVADPREGMARRPDGQTVFIHVCEHPTPVAEMRRIHDTVAGTLGHRTLQAFQGSDVAQLKILLNLAGYFRAGLDTLPEEGLTAFDQEVAEAVDRFRTDAGLATPALGSPPALVDAEFVEALWAALAREGQDVEARRRIADYTRIRR
ncbi:MAG TPA: DUF1028 domain-containing protein [Longimicrobiales bacterium]|nr:DUF1028 domain-containing protein [Longimicrobiales bacterium]